MIQRIQNLPWEQWLERVREWIFVLQEVLPFYALLAVVWLYMWVTR